VQLQSSKQDMQLGVKSRKLTLGVVLNSQPHARITVNDILQKSGFRTGRHKNTVSVTRPAVVIDFVLLERATWREWGDKKKVKRKER
jgi:hypothetical protein